MTPKELKEHYILLAKQIEETMKLLDELVPHGPRTRPITMLEGNILETWFELSKLLIRVRRALKDD